MGIVGLGYVGLTLAIVLAEVGTPRRCPDIAQGARAGMVGLDEGP